MHEILMVKNRNNSPCVVVGDVTVRGVIVDGPPKVKKNECYDDQRMSKHDFIKYKLHTRWCHYCRYIALISCECWWT
jgi:hypothetical protein